MLLKVCETGSSGNGYAIDCNGEILILEAGCKFIHMKRMLDYDISRISGLFVSHEHG